MVSTVTAGIGTLSLAVTGCTGNGVSPIVLTIGAGVPASVKVGQSITVASVGGNTNANGDKTITAVGATTITFAGTGNGAYTSGGTVSRKYSSIGAWETATQGNLVSANEIRVGEVYDDGDMLYLFSADLTIAGSTTDATRYRILRAWSNASASHWYDPVTREGVRIVKAVDSTHPDVLTVSEEYFRLQGIYFEATGTPTSGGPYRWVNVTAASAQIDACFVRGSTAIDSTLVTVEGISHSAGATDATHYLLVTNSIVVGAGTAGLGVTSGFRSAKDYDRFLNCDAFRCSGSTTGRGFHTNGTNQQIRNCISIESSFADFNVSGTATFTHCISSDATATGLASFTGEYAANLWLYADYDDFRLRQSASGVDAGVDLSAQFTADIIAATRTVPWEIGCYNGYGTPVTSSPTVVVKTIGSAGGRDYATIAAWLAATDENLVSGPAPWGNTVQVGEVYNDSTFSLGGTDAIVSGAVTDATRYRMLRPATGHEYDPPSDSGVKISGATTTDAIRIDEDYFRLQGPIYVENLAAGTDDRSCVKSTADVTLVTRVFGYFPNGTAGDRGPFRGTGLSQKWRNSIAVGNDNTNGASYGFYVTGSGSKVANCNALKIRRGASGTCFKDGGGAGGVRFQNCIAGSSDIGFDVVDGFQDHNASVDTTAAGLGSFTSIAPNDNWVDSAGYDFRLLATSPLINQGVKLATEFTDDFAGATRTGAWEIGAYDGYLVPPAYPAVDLLTTHRIAIAWRVERVDGVEQRYTDNNSPLVVLGQTFTPVGGFDASARRKEISLAEHNLQAEGLIAAGYITFADLVNERYRGARVTEYVVDHKFPWRTPIRTTVYYLRAIRWDGEKWSAQFGGLSSLLDSPIGHVYGPQCQRRLGDASTGCPVDLAAFTQFDVAVTSVTTAKSVFAASSLSSSFVDDYFKFGVLTWKTGDNAGLQSEVATYTQSGRVIELFLDVPFDVQVGDTFDLVAGDDLTGATCADKFNAYESFQGFEFIPGTDKALQTPTQ